MSRWDMDAEEFARMLRHAADCITYTNKVTSFHDCNDCGKKDCKYRPKLGEMTRINCPLWESKQ